MSNERQGFTDTRSILTTDNTKANIDITSVIALAEGDGTQKFSNYGKVGSTLTAISLAANGEQDFVLHGEDEANNVDPVRTDPNRILWTRPHAEYVNLVAVELTTSDAALIDGSAVLTASAVYRVWYKVNNIDGTNAATYTIGTDVAAGGALASPEYWAFQENVPAGASSGWVLGGIMNAADDIRGLASANSDLVVQFEVVRVDTGA